MFHRNLAQMAAASLLLMVAPIRGDEENLWPLKVHRLEGDCVTDEFVGPLFFQRTDPSGEQAGLRPVYLHTTTADREEHSLLYPFFVWRKQEDYRSFTFFQLINTRTDATGEGPADHRFDVWPFWFSRDNGDPAASYQALFPVGGTIKNRFGRDRINFVAFPLYSHTEKDGRHITHALWPFLRFVEGDGHEGFEFWPLYGHVTREGDYDRRFWLWPLFYRSARKLSEPEPEVKIGALPFYTRDTAPGYINENYAWPFFGYSDRTVPYRYHETRWLWPFLVQGRGDERYVNRWAPFYSHSIIKGTNKTWLLWPLLRRQAWEADGLAQEKTQVLFFLYWSLDQHSPDRPTAPSAHKRHFWPLFSSWDNGAGRRQIQALSPFEVFFPRNDTIRRLWTPLFALYRYDRQPDAREHHALLWNAISWRRGPEQREFHLGPLASYHATADQRRIAIGNGLIGIRRKPGDRAWRAFLFDFSKPSAMKAPAATSP